MRLAAENMDIARGDRLLVQGCSFVLEPGEALAVTGPNGVGKSTLLRALAGFLPLARGRVTSDSGDGSGLAGQAHYLGHANALKGSLTALENLEFWAALLRPAGAQARLDAGQALQALGLAHVANLPCAYL